MTEQYLAFMIGLLGSVHCIGMCGPLAFAVPSLQKGAGWLLLDKALYQIGRILSYCLLGLIIGLIGRQLWMAGLQQMVSILTGLLVILAGASRIFKIAYLGRSTLLLKPFHRLIGFALKHKANHLIIGMINGLLPCGFVYLALAGAVNMPDLTGAIGYMFFFGLGTAPLMLIAAMTVGLTGSLMRSRINRVLPYLMVCLGIWFILRGLELNIPYLSPAPHDAAAVCK